MDQFDLYRTFDDFLDNSLSEEESAQFEKRLASDDGLMEEFTNYRAANRMGEAYSLLQIRQQLQTDISSGYADKQIQKRKAIKTILPLALLICGLMSIPFFLSEPKTDQEIKQKDLAPRIEPKIHSDQIHQTPLLKRSVDTTNTPIEPIPEANKHVTPPSHLETTGTITNGPEVFVAETPKIDTHQSNRETESAKDPCIGFNPKTTLKTSSSESGLDNGEILVMSAESNLDISIDQTVFTPLKKGKFLFTNLPPDNYVISIKNQAGCLKTSSTVVKEKSVQITIPEPLEFAFRAEFGEELKLPIQDYHTGQMVIRDYTGEIVDQFEIINGYPNSWNGESINFQPGLYVFLLKLENDKNIQGTVRIY